MYYGCLRVFWVWGKIPRKPNVKRYFTVHSAVYVLCRVCSVRMGTHTHISFCFSLHRESEGNNRFEIGTCFFLLLCPIYFVSCSYSGTNRLYRFVDLRQIGRLSHLKITVKSLVSTNSNFRENYFVLQI